MKFFHRYEINPVIDLEFSKIQRARQGIVGFFDNGKTIHMGNEQAWGFCPQQQTIP